MPPPPPPLHYEKRYVQSTANLDKLILILTANPQDIKTTPYGCNFTAWSNCHEEKQLSKTTYETE